MSHLHSAAYIFAPLLIGHDVILYSENIKLAIVLRKISTCGLMNNHFINSNRLKGCACILSPVRLFAKRQAAQD